MKESLNEIEDSMKGSNLLLKRVPECENNAIVTFEDPSIITNEQQAIIDFNEKMSKIWPQDVGTFM